ncbi:hypothetical protein [Fibrobacter sp. UWEL]|uniref:hypothetical protein n=1 Tax=Fibrobacter sp. UWEL TaxID=1896209 RepID=UPI00091B1A36|nr:hypothetical protein [Fibrobacter sp. UWEL]SHK94100.1 hypothetical protein SAMN05720468_1103 [Fibrobacter sp. UWEL]
MEQKIQDENPLMRNPEYRRLYNEKNKLVKQMNSIQLRMDKYAYALSDKDMQQLQQRLDVIANRLADLNDQMADIEEAGSKPASTHWVGHASQELKQASRQAAR